MRRTFNRFLPSAFIVTLSLGAARLAFSDGPSDTPRMPTVMPAPAAGQNEAPSGTPLILNLGPPPVVYSPSADFSTRVETAPGWAVASDTRTAANTPAHPVVSAPPMMPSYGVPIVQFDAPIPVAAAPCFDCPQPMHTAMQPHALPSLPSYYAPPPSPPFAFPTASAPSAYNPAVVYPSQLATPMTLPAPRANQVYSSPAAGEADQLDHILQAVHHLEAAGLQADADRLRRECDDKVERLIACLKSNGAALPRLHPAPQQSAEANEANQHRPMVMAQMYMLDIDVNKLAALANNADANAVARFAKANLADPQQGGFETFKGDAAALKSAIESLQKRGVATIVSRPQIMTASGEEAELQIGQTVPHQGFTASGEPCIQEGFVGTCASVLPEVVDHDTVRMAIRWSVTENGSPTRNREVQTVVLSHSGDPVLISGLRTVAEGKTTCQLIAISPQIVKSDDMPPPLPVATNSGYSCEAAPCGEAVYPASAQTAVCPAPQACNNSCASGGPCTCEDASACDGACGGNCTCTSAAAHTNETTDAQHRPIMLHVELLEVNRTKCRELGFEIAFPDGSGGPTGSQLLKIVQALKKEGVARVLSDPSICTVSGRPVQFNCGGEFPVPNKHADGSIAVEYRKFGTQIDCVPLVRDNGNLRLEFRARLSEIDPALGCHYGDTTYPGLRVREFDNAMELKPGQAMVVTGPVETRLSAQMEEIADLPPVVEQLMEQCAGCFENHPLIATVAGMALENLGISPVCHEVTEEEELQFVAVVCPTIGDGHEAQSVFDTTADGCDCGRGCCLPNSLQQTGKSCGAESAISDCPCHSSFAVRPVSCFDLPSVTSSLFERPLFDAPLLPSCVQKAIFTTPELINGQSPASFNFDFQMPVLPEFDLAEPVRTPLR